MAWSDFDNDGWLDLVVANAMGQTQVLLRGAADGFFESMSESVISTTAVGDTQAVCFVDTDNDGDLDLCASAWDGPIAIFEQADRGVFHPVTLPGLTDLDARASGTAWCDIDADGDLDVFIVNRDNTDDTLLLNDGGVFRVSLGPWAERGGDGRVAAWGDIDGDGDLDLFVGNYSGQPNVLYRNLGDARFESVEQSGATENEAYTYGANFADLDSDGDADLYVTNVGAPNELFLNDGSGGFAPVGTDLHVTGRDPSKGQVIADFDLDGDLDIFVANGTEHPRYTGFPNRLYLQNDGAFQETAADVFAGHRDISAGVAAGDYDNDGDLDLVVTNWGGAGEDNVLLRNATQGRHWISIRLHGEESNRYGIGACIRVVAGINGERVTQTRWILPQTGYASQNEYAAHFGLGDAQRVDAVRIHWPSGSVDTYESLDADQFLIAREQRTLETDPLRSPAEIAVTHSSRPHRVRDVYPYWGADDRIVFQSDRSGVWQLYSMAPDGSDVRRLTHGDGDDRTPAVSPDGRSIVFQSHRDGNPEVYVIDTDGSNPRRLTNHPADDEHPHWTADGEWIIFNSQRDGDGAPQIYRMRPDGGDLQRIVQSNATDTYSSRSPLDERILTRRLAPDESGSLDSEVLVLNSDGAVAVNLSEHVRYDGWPRWSPEGRRVVFASNRTGQFRVYVIASDGSTIHRISDDDSDADTQPSWSPDGLSLCFTRYNFDASGQERSSIGVVSLRISEPPTS